MNEQKPVRCDCEWNPEDTYGGHFPTCAIVLDAERPECVGGVDVAALVAERLEIAKLSLNELIENDVADLFGMPHTDEGRHAAMEAFLRKDASAYFELSTVDFGVTSPEVFTVDSEHEPPDPLRGAHACLGSPDCKVPGHPWNKKS